MSRKRSRPEDEYPLEAVETWQRVQQQAERARAAGEMMFTNVTGVDSDGRTPRGSYGWEFRPFDRPLLDHEGKEVKDRLGNQVLTQQDPPTHVTGAHYAKPGKRRPRGLQRMGEASRADATARELADLGEGLTADQRKVFALKADGCTYEQIAQQLGIGVDAVRERLRRARARLRRLQEKNEPAT